MHSILFDMFKVRNKWKKKTKKKQKKTNKQTKKTKKKDSRVRDGISKVFDIGNGMFK